MEAGLDARRCIARMDELHIDFTLLFWLRNLDVLATSDLWTDMTSLLVNCGIREAQFRNPKYREGFFKEVRTVFKARGILPVSPQNFVVCCGTGGKIRALDAAKAAKWPRPHQTFCFQTIGEQFLFFVFQSWQDGIAKMAKILGDRSVCVEEHGTERTIRVDQIYEHCWGDQRLSRILIDWEIQEEWAKKRMSAADIHAVGMEFPAWFVREMMRRGILSPHGKVRCVVKDKSRTLAEGGEKVSFHFVFNIAGIPRASHRVACGLVIDSAISSFLRRIREARNLDCLPDDKLRSPWIGVDLSTTSGGHGFSVPFSRKRITDPVPSIPCIIHVSRETQAIQKKI